MVGLALNLFPGWCDTQFWATLGCFSLFTELNYLLWSNFEFAHPEYERRALVLLLWGKWWWRQFFLAQWKHLMKLIFVQPLNSVKRESMKEHVGAWLELSLLSSGETLSLCNSLNLLICSQHIFSVFFQGSFNIALLLGLDTCFSPQEVPCHGARQGKLWCGSAKPCYPSCFSITLVTWSRGAGLKFSSVMENDYA